MSRPYEVNWGENAPIASNVFRCAGCDHVSPTIRDLVGHSHAQHGIRFSYDPELTRVTNPVPVSERLENFRREWNVGAGARYRELERDHQFDEVRGRFAESKAWLLLADVLGFDAAYSLMDPEGTGRIEVQGNNGKTYFVTRDGELYGEDMKSMCVQPLEEYPLADKILMKVLWVKTNAAGVEKIANTTKRLSGKGVIEY